jgi:hypothetical protein
LHTEPSGCCGTNAASDDAPSLVGTATATIGRSFGRLVLDAIGAERIASAFAAKRGLDAFGGASSTA